MPIFIIIPIIIALVAAIVLISIKVFKMLITHLNSTNKKTIHNSDIEKTKIKDL